MNSILHLCVIKIDLFILILQTQYYFLCYENEIIDKCVYKKTFPIPYLAYCKALITR